MEPKAIVVAGNGINADAELAEALRAAGAAPERIHVSELVADPERLLGARIVGFPGGFSYGDHLGSGQVLALLVRRSLKAALERFVAEGGFVIGICNGFQALARMGMLPNRAALAGSAPNPRSSAAAPLPAAAWEREVALIHNAGGRFVDDWAPVRFEAESRCVWTKGLAPRLLPIRHGEGRFVAKDAATLASLEAEGLVALRYGLEGGTPPPGAPPCPGNPNGSEADIAGICDPTGRVLGLMPHPEAFLVAENHPGRRRGRRDPTGLDLFENGVRAARGK
ncbi:MAG: phosphoribosylformylglycinamidine synthase subunit PurQ [Spirochaetaceae bacterium]|nr:phosphoribosylformylglycinamidine synthase subunit PurQ [Spirochaetaceae bacterium]